MRSQRTRLLTCLSLILLPLISATVSCSPAPAQAPEPTPPAPEPSAQVPEQSPDETPEAPPVAPKPVAVAETAPQPAEEPAQAPPPASRCPDGMQLVPGGAFVTAQNKREVKVADLCVDTFETTAAQYKECVDAGKCTTNLVLCSEQSTWGKEKLQNHPMVCVDFSQAVDYCSFRDKRLPETGEWEWVARGGEEARKYPWGNEEPNDQLCWQGKKPLEGTCEIGSFPKGVSAHGIHDLAGGVHEFTTTAQDATGKIRIARGGSWKEGDSHMMWPGRIGGFETSYRCGFLGIRCVTEAPPEEGTSRDNRGTQEGPPVTASSTPAKAP